MKLKGRQRYLALTLAAVLVLTTAVFIGTLALASGLGKGRAQTAMAAPACARTHVVRRGETLSAIAQRYGLTTSQLAQANHLRNYDFIYVGQTLCLPTTGGGGQPVGSICVEGRKVDEMHRGLGGFVINAQMEGSDQVLQAVTDDNGYFRFDNLAPGLWTFSEVLPAGWEPVTASEFQKELEYGHEGCYQIRFKNRQVPIPACLIVAKMNEADGAPLEGWEIQIRPEYGDQWLSGVTDKGGQVRFDDLEPGTWIVREVIPYPWEAVEPYTGETEIELHPMANEDDCGRLVFKNRRKLTGCVEGYKVDDKHQGLPGWTICAHPTGAMAPEFCTVTDEDGYFRFDDLTLGEWTLWEEVQPGWTPITAQEFTVTVDEAGGECKQVRFKNRPPDLCAQGYKLDENGFGLGGWTIRAWPKDNPDEALITVTEPNGHYRICGVTLGTWVFEEERPVGWVPLVPERQEVEVVYPGPGKDVDAPIFRNAPPRGCIEGWKVDEFEVGLPKWNITIRNTETGQEWHRWTDGTGYFKVCDLPMGDYEVWEEMQPGWKPVSPPKVMVTLEPSDEPIMAIVVFVNKQMGRDICIDGYKKDLFDGAGLPNWQIKLLDLEGNVLATTTTDGTGYYRFSNLEPGTYIVAETVQDGWLPATASSRRVTVTWPPRYECEGRADFWNRQETVPAPCARWHIVKRCETLSSIALHYGVPISKLMAANGLTDPDFIWVGQKLCIPDP